MFSKYDKFIGKILGRVKILKSYGRTSYGVKTYLCECLDCKEKIIRAGSKFSRSKLKHLFCQFKFILKKCRGCYKKFHVRKSQKNKASYCSLNCRRKNFKSKVKHGKRSKYNSGCRCKRCTKALRIYMKKFYNFVRKSKR